MPSRCCEFVDSRLRRSPPDRASAVPCGQAGENAMRFPHLVHRSAAAHKLHSTPQQHGMILISGNGETSSRLDAFSLFFPGSCPNNRDRRIPRIDQADVVAGLRERVNDPHKQNQGAASLCGPAAFFYCVLNYKPELYVQYVIDLFTTGKARIGSLKVEPSLPCRVSQPTTDRIAPVKSL